MRAYLVPGMMVLVALSALPAAGAPSDDAGELVQDTLDEANAPFSEDLLRLGKDDNPAGPASSSGGRGDGSMAAVSSAVLAPVTGLTKSLVDLGLEILNGLLSGVSTGAKTFGAAAATVAAAPAKSAAIAGSALGLVGLLSTLAVALKRYGSLGAIPLFSRIAKSELLDNEVRSQIFEFIRANPGVNVSEISRQLDIAWGTATHHLQKLRAERLVGIRSVGHQKCFFPNGGTYTPREMDVLSATKNATAHRIAEFLVERGSCAHQEIAHGLALSPALVSFHVRKLMAAGVVERRKEGRRSIFSPLESNLRPTPRPMATHL